MTERREWWYEVLPNGRIVMDLEDNGGVHVREVLPGDELIMEGYRDLLRRHAALVEAAKAWIEEWDEQIKRLEEQYCTDLLFQSSFFCRIDALRKLLENEDAGNG